MQYIIVRRELEADDMKQIGLGELTANYRKHTLCWRDIAKHSNIICQILISKSKCFVPRSISRRIELFNMEFKKSATPRSARQRVRGHIKVDTPDLYSHCLQLYRLPPTDTISLEEFEDLAVERLKGWCFFFKHFYSVE